MKKSIIITMLFASFPLWTGASEMPIAQRLSGRILIQTESHGEAWYINPSNLKKYFLGSPSDAFTIIKLSGTGIKSSDLNKIKIGILGIGKDSDTDGLDDRLENAIGTDPRNIDSDADGFDDKTEILNSYNPLGKNKIAINADFTTKNSGKIFLEVEKNGEAWYVNPSDQKRYYLENPLEAYAAMKKFGLGIKNSDLEKIEFGSVISENPEDYELEENAEINDGSEVVYSAAEAIRSNNIDETVSFFTSEMEKAIRYTMNFLDANGRLALGNILSGTRLETENSEEKIYSTEVYFSLGGYKVPVKFHVKKQPDGKWLLANL